VLHRELLMMISFAHLQVQRDRPWGPYGLALYALFLTAALAFAQQPADVVPPSQPAEISKDSPALAPPDAKGDPASSAPPLQTHPSPAAAAAAQRAARQPDDPSATERQDPDVTAREPAARPKRFTPPLRSSPAPSP